MQKRNEQPIVNKLSFWDKVKVAIVAHHKGHTPKQAAQIIKDIESDTVETTFEDVTPKTLPPHET